MNKILLITAPDHDATTRYLSAWSSKILELAGKKNIQVINLKRNRFVFFKDDILTIQEVAKVLKV
ncbi:hypothetical protein KKC04_02515, partial [Patescibacteria group bacterium]|nr:hypothetical protein [Patescibacteria group bacterium]